MRGMVWLGVIAIAGCAGGPQIGYESAPSSMQPGDSMDSGEAQALEQAEAGCARQGKHATSQRIEGETVYGCAD